jgi:hypothetical protein
LGLLSGYKIRAVIKVIENKLGVKLRGGKELKAWYCLDGKKVLLVRVPKGHGNAELHPRTANRVMNCLRTDKSEFRSLYECPMSGSAYERKIRNMDIK